MSPVEKNSWLSVPAISMGNSPATMIKIPWQILPAEMTLWDQFVLCSHMRGVSPAEGAPVGL